MYINVSRNKNFIIEILYDKNGNKKIIKKCEGLPLQLGIKCDRETGYKDLYGKNVEPHDFDNIKDYYRFIKENSEYYEVLGNINPIYQYISDKYSHDFEYNLDFIKTFIIDIEVDSILYDDKKKILVGSEDDKTEMTLSEIDDKWLPDQQNGLLMIDDNDNSVPYSRNIFMLKAGFPDPSEALYPITSIAIKDDTNDKYYVCATKNFDKCKSVIGVDIDTIDFYHAQDEEHIFSWFINLMRTELPDILVGWYSNNFDFPYIINRSYKIFDDDHIKKISPYGKLTCTLKEGVGEYGRDVWKTFIGGVYTLDYMEIYKKFVNTPRSSYSLDFVSGEELDTTKLNYNEYDNLNDLWFRNPQHYIDYNIFDVELISLMDKKLNLMNILFMISYKALGNFNDALGTIGVWDSILYNKLKTMNIFIPPKKHNEKEHFVGAYVKDPIPDIYPWCISEDLDSLYPHIQMQYHISPECLIGDESISVDQDALDTRILTGTLKGNPKYIMAGNGQYFDKNKEGFIPTILKEIYAERKAVKKKMLEKKQELVDIKELLKEFD